MANLEAHRPRYFRATNPNPHKPLVEYCTNEWQNRQTYEGSEPDNCWDSIELFLERARDVLKAPKFRRFLLLILFLIMSSVVLWIKILAPLLHEEKATWSSLSKSVESAEGDVFGANMRPRFPGMIQVSTLDPDLLPGASKGKNGRNSPKKRLVFIGDIHGCKEELEALLKKLHFNPMTDHLVAVGDIVSKGPDSLGVIELLRHYKASCVRGNHEDRLLLIVEDLQSTSLTSTKNPRVDAISITGRFGDLDEAERKLALSLKADQIAWLKSFPVILRIGGLKAFPGDAVVVHGGLVPGLPLEQQDPSAVMNMRLLDLRTHIPSNKHERKGSVPWFKLWNKYQQLLPARQLVTQLKSMGRSGVFERKVTVIYGHDAKQGLQIKKYTKGLDSSCVRGGKLTALVVGEDGKEKIIQVPCKDHRQRPPIQVDVDDTLRTGKLGPPVRDEEDLVPEEDPVPGEED